jgi:hypothetical protein
MDHQVWVILEEPAIKFNLFRVKLSTKYLSKLSWAVELDVWQTYSDRKKYAWDSKTTQKIIII